MWIHVLIWTRLIRECSVDSLFENDNDMFTIQLYVLKYFMACHKVCQIIYNLSDIYIYSS